jgi:hypothetical protein
MTVDRGLRQLAGRYPGIELELHGGNVVLVSAAGASYEIPRANKLDPSQLARARQWLDRHADAARAASRQQARYRDNREKSDTSGAPMASVERRASLKRLETLRREWPKLLPEEQVAFVREAVVVIAERDDRYRAAREVFGL